MIMKRLNFLYFLIFLISSISTIAYAYDGQVKDSNNINFKDATVKQLCVANWDTDGDGELSYEEAAAIKNLKDVFYSNKEISTFDELCFFTSLTNIPEEAFKGCRNLSSIQIPEGVTTIGESAFSCCTNLSSISIPNSVINIDSWAFSQTAWLDNKGDGIVYAGLVAYDYKGDMPENTTITIKEGTIGIASLAFYGKSEITSVNIPMSITNIGQGAFHGCSNLSTVNLNCPIVGEWFSEITSIKTVNLGEKVQAIGASAFNGCTGLMSINIPDHITQIGGKAFYHCSSLKSIRLPENLRYIHEQAFAGCSSLESVTLPQGVQGVLYINDNAFANCSSLHSINLPIGITILSQCLFMGCKNLNSIVIPESVMSIENFAFMNCKSLTSISIPKGVTSIGESSFYGCNSLTEVSINSEEPLALTINTFSNRENATLIVPHGCKAAYEAAEYWNEFKEIVEKQEPFIDFADANVKSICVSNWDTDGDGELSFDEAAAVTSLKNVFTNKKNIQSFDELQYFTGLKSINLMDFSSCSELTSIRIPENVTNIALSAFSACTKLASVNIPESVTSIGTNAFYQCTSLSSITIPKNVNSISNNCFAGCSQLASITVDAENVVFDSRGNCNAIINKENSSLIAGCKNTTIPESVTDIASDAFRECTALLSITIPEGVRSIGSKAFDGCSALISVTINQPEPISISSTTFSNSVNATLYVPYKSKSVYASTDFWQDFKAIVEMPPTVFTLSDGQSFSNDEEIFVERLNYSRTFKNTNWQAWYVPFDVTLTSEILAHFAFAEFAGTYAEEDGSFYITVVRLKEGDVVKANTPYCVQAKVADSSNPQVISQTDVILKTSTVNSFYVLSARKRITFFGNYTHRTVTAEDENLYALSGGRYSKQQPGNTLAPYRCFFTIEDREDNPYATAPNPSEVKLMVIGEDDTFISELDFDNEVGPTVYDLNGRKVNRQKTTHGIYIINGKKVIIK